MSGGQEEGGVQGIVSGDGGGVRDDFQKRSRRGKQPQKSKRIN